MEKARTLIINEKREMRNEELWKNPRYADFAFYGEPRRRPAVKKHDIFTVF